VTEQNWDRMFDEVYLKTYAPLQDPAEAETMAAGAARLAELEPGADVLDTACGFGRHAIPLARAGYRVVGCDRSAVLLEEARRRAEGAEWPRFVRGDYRELPFEDASFDAALNLFTSFGFYGEEDDARTLREFHRVLRPAGRLVLEIMHRDRLMSIFQPRSWDTLPDGGLLLEEREFDHVSGFVTTLHEYRPPDAPPVPIRFSVRAYTATELVRMAEAAGFAQVDAFGGLDRERLARQTRLVLLARKAS